MSLQSKDSGKRSQSSLTNVNYVLSHDLMHSLKSLLYNDCILCYDEGISFIYIY